ncbi:enoyl-CoA hydratase/carnithine racemase [Bradyrhizobium sp. LB1.3]
MEERVSISISEGVADVRLVRADKMNALDQAMFEALVAATDRLSKDKSVRVVVLSGEGRAFCAGLDMGRFAAMKEKGGNGIPGGENRDLTARTHGQANFAQAAVWGWRQLPVPVIAAIQGVAFGGGFQLALGADMRFLTPDARMSVMEIKWGLVPDMAGTPILASLVRDDILRDLTYTGRIFSAQEAMAYGSRHAHLRRPARCRAGCRARDRRQESRCDPRRKTPAQQSLGRSGARAARRVRRAAEADRQREPDRGGAFQSGEARAEVCGLRQTSSRGAAKRRLEGWATGSHGSRQRCAPPHHEGQRQT